MSKPPLASHKVRQVKKNGSILIAVVDRERFQSGVWDPYTYRENGKCRVVGDFVRIERLNGGRVNPSRLLFEPIEYRHIPRGNFLTFVLEPKVKEHPISSACAPESTLLFGTMRAYLGNVIVTPKAEWLGLGSPLCFLVKSEFVKVVPKDGLLYFWWAYLKSSGFLHNVPVGSGGTRPRLHPELLLQIPIKVPTLEVRREIHVELGSIAENAWSQFMGAERLVRSVCG